MREPTLVLILVAPSECGNCMGATSVISVIKSDVHGQACNVIWIIKNDVHVEHRVGRAWRSVPPAMEKHTPKSCNGKSYLKIVPQIVPQIVQKPPKKPGYSEKVFARFEVRFEVRLMVPPIVPKNSCDRIGLSCR